MNRSFATSWLAGNADATLLLTNPHRDAPLRAAAVHQAAQRQLDPRVHAVLVRQNAALPPCPLRDRHLALLAQPGTAVIASGQQVGLLGGPLYTLYKAVTAIALARDLNAQTGVACVPLFWLQTEDHDFAEINHALVPHANGPIRLEVPDDGARIPVAHRQLDDTLQAVFAQLETALTGLPHATETLTLLQASYQPGRTVVAAFAHLMATLLHGHGLIFMNPRDAELASLAAPLHQQLLDEALPIADLLTERVHAIEATGLAAQVHVRAGSPLSFVSPDAIDGPRYRLDPRGANTWTLVGHPEGATVTTAQLHTWLANEPLRFTTSALSRPLLQDLWLPTAAYVGGPGEMAYFAQLAPLYAHLKLRMPLAVHRGRFALVDARTTELAQQLRLDVHALTGPRDVLERRLAEHALADGFMSPEAFGAQFDLDAAFAQAELLFARLDPQLPKSAARTREVVADATQKLVDKYTRALAQRDRALLQRLDRARLWLAPEGVPQERGYCLAGPAARFGVQRLVDAVLNGYTPWATGQQELSL